MCSACRFCLPVYLDLSPLGISLTPLPIITPRYLQSVRQSGQIRRRRGRTRQEVRMKVIILATILGAGCFAVSGCSVEEKPPDTTVVNPSPNVNVNPPANPPSVHIENKTTNPPPKTGGGY